MIAVSDTSVLPDLSPSIVIPSVQQISALIPASAFVNSSITAALKNLFVEISTAYYNPLNPSFQSFKEVLVRLFKLAGFRLNSNGTLIFSSGSKPLDEITRIIIDDLNFFNTFKDKANNAFTSGSWAKAANDIRGLTGTGLQRIHYFGVYNSEVENENFLLNRKEESYRFVRIEPSPEMPHISIYNYSNNEIKIRLKIEFTKTRKSDGTGTVFRKFLDYFPSPDEEGVKVHLIPTNSFKKMSFDKIRGGIATVEFVVANESWATANIKKFVFHIRGINPTTEIVRQYLEQPLAQGEPSPLSRFWFLRRLARHESGTPNKSETLYQFNPDGDGISSNNNQRGLPTFGPPRGYGLGQIDNFGRISSTDALKVGVDLKDLKPGGKFQFQTLIDTKGRTVDRDGVIVASDDVVWNWKENIRALIQVLEDKIPLVKNRINTIRSAVVNWNSSHPNDKVVLPADNKQGEITYSWVKSSIPDLNSNSIDDLFSSDQVSSEYKKSFFDAMLLKTYNGLGSEAFGHHHFLHLSYASNGKPILSIEDEAKYKDKSGVIRINKYVQAIGNTNE